MTKSTLRGLLCAMLIGALMVAGVLAAAGAARADTQQDYEFITTLQERGWIITNPRIMKQNAIIICDQLATGRDWRLIVTDIMTGADYSVESAGELFAAAVIVYCPALNPLQRTGQTASSRRLA